MHQPLPNVIVNPGRVRVATATWHGVTFGSRGSGEKDGRTLEGVSIIDDRVSIGPGACLFGPIEVGHDVSVRAGAVLMSSLSRSSPELVDESLRPETGSGAHG